MTDALQKAQALLKDAIVIDGLGGAIVHPTPYMAEGTYEESLVGYGWTAMNATLVSEPTYSATWDEVLKAIHENYLYFDMSPKARLVEKASDILEAKKNGQLGVIFGLQSPSCIEQDRTRLNILHKLGLRVLQLTYMERNYLGDGCLEPENRGLTHFGIQVIRECNRIGILVDCSHVGIRTTLDAAEHSSKPIVISHAAVRAIADNPRGVTDEMMKAVAKTGGVIGFIPLGPLIRLDRSATLDDYLDHFQHALDLVGPDHVSLATDMFDGKTKANWATPWYYPEITRGVQYGSRRVAGYTKKADLVHLVAAFVKRGFADDVILKILGGNFLRVVQTVWRP